MSVPQPEVSLLYFLGALVYTVALMACIPFLRGKFKRHAFFDPPTTGGQLDKAEESVPNPLTAGADSNPPPEQDAVSGGDRETMREQVLGDTSIKNSSEADIENFRESINNKSGAHEDFETRRSNLERESLSRLTVEGHVAFDSEKLKLILPSPNYPHNSGKRVNRRLRESIRRNFEAQVLTCLADGADPMHRVTFAFSILNEAIVTPCSDQIVSLIIERYPSLVNARTTQGTTPLMHAIMFHRSSVATMLLEHGAHVNDQDLSGHTPLMVGAMFNNPYAALLLIPWGADPDLVDTDGRRAVDLALLYGNARVASDLQGSALAVVPGYIAPKVQTNYDGLTLIYTIGWHGFDVATDVILAINLAQTGHPALSFFTAFFLLLPSVFICLIPYQSTIERFLTVIQMRIVYEGLISMGQERLTVRFGATQMYHTVLQNVPQAMMQSFMLALVLRGENNFGGDRTSLILAILTTVYQSTATFHNMYLLRFFVKNHDAGTEPFTLKIALTIGVMLGVILRVTMWASILLTQPGVIIILLSWVFISRFRLIGMGLEGITTTKEGDEASSSSPATPAVAVVAAPEGSSSVITSVDAEEAAASVAKNATMSVDSTATASYSVSSSSSSPTAKATRHESKASITSQRSQQQVPVDRNKLESTVVDLFATFLCDMPFITVPSCYLASVLFSSLEMILVLGACAPSWDDFQAVNTMISFYWLWFTFSLGIVVYLHGEHCTMPTTEFWWDFLSLSKFGRQLLDLYLLAWSNLIFTMTFLWLEAKDAWTKLRPIQTTATLQQQQDQQQKEQRQPKHNKSNSAPVAPPMIQERVWRLLCACPEVSWEHLEPREMMSMGLVAVIILLLIFYLFALVIGQCEQVSSTLGSDDYLETPRNNTDHGIHCASYFSAQMGYFCIGVAPYLLIVFAFGYIVEAVTCHVAMSLRNLCHEERGFTQYLQARAKAPSFKWFSESFHYETRTETYTESDGRGGTRTATRTVTVKVVTHTATAYYSFDYWLDDSAPFPHSHPLCRIQSVNQYQFDEYTREDYNTKYAQFKRENDRDTHQACSDTFLIGNSTNLALPAMMIFSDEAPYFLRYTYYLCAMLVLQAPYYRWAVTGMSVAKSVPIVKIVRVCRPDDPVLTNLLLRYGDKDVDDADADADTAVVVVKTTDPATVDKTAATSVAPSAVEAADVTPVAADAGTVSPVTAASDSSV